MLRFESTLRVSAKSIFPVKLYSGGLGLSKYYNRYWINAYIRFRHVRFTPCCDRQTLLRLFFLLITLLLTTSSAKTFSLRPMSHRGLHDTN